MNHEIERAEEFEQYLDLEIENVKKSLEASLETENSLLSKKNTAVLYQLNLIRKMYEKMPLEELYDLLKLMDETLDEEIDAYLDIDDNAYDESHYLCSSIKKSSLKSIINKLNKIIEMISQILR